MERIVHFVKAALAELLVRSGLFFTVHRLRRPHVLVLAYHRVTPDDEMEHCAYPAMHVSASTFARQLQELQRLYRIVPLSEARRAIAGDAPLDGHIAVVTFDDGYRDNYREALPILSAQGVPATFFVSVDFVDRGEAFWFDRVAAAARACAGGGVHAEQLDGLPARLVAALLTPGSVARRARAAAAYLKRVCDAERERLVELLVAKTPAKPDLHEAMSWTEVQALEAAGMTVGAHGIRHGILTRMPREVVAEEISASMAAVAERVGAAVDVFAYPNGNTNARVESVARSQGVGLAFTTNGKTARPGCNPLHVSRRNACEASSRGRTGFSPAYFFCEIAGVFDAVTARHWRES